MKNKAFTLIEVLAVIVILAIIVLIAVPAVTNIINNASKSAFKTSAYGLLKAGELYYQNELSEKEENKVFIFPNDIEGLKIKGSKPKSGAMIIDKDGKISLAISNGKYCIIKELENEDVQISEEVKNCRLPDVVKIITLTDLAVKHSFTRVDGTNPIEVSEVDDCVTSGICEVGTAFAIKVNDTEIYKFYVLSDTGKEVTLIMDRNLYNAEDLISRSHNVLWVNAIDYGGTTVTNDKGPLTALKFLKERTSSWTNIPSHTYTLENDDDGSMGSNTYNSISKSETTEESVVENVRARLPRKEELVAAGCTISSGSCKLWLYENLNTTGDSNAKGYWTSTTHSSTSYNAWIVGNKGNLEASMLIKSSGIRPVITLSK